MKKIVPFNNVLKFDTDVKEITAISLEHKIDTKEDSINGVFYITGEYKIIDGQIEKEKFNFELPFDIALGSNYNLETLVVDIDDFRYELVENNKLKVNIDLYIDGEVIEEELFTEKEKEILKKNTEEDTEPILTKIQERLDLLDEMINNNKEQEEKPVETNTSVENKNTIFNNFTDEEKYVTYRVYTVLENDTLDKILEKYHISKEELSKYNKLEDFHSGLKLIVPAQEDNDK